MSTITTEMEQSLRDGTLECAVCSESIDAGPLWNCERCFGILHQKCALKWAQQQQSSSAAAAASSSSSPSSSSLLSMMTCPSCRAPCAQQNSPSQDPTCFCRKTTFDSHTRPDRLLLVGSCGEMCGRRSARAHLGCPHPCPLLCHPGACPECQLTRQQECFCGNGDKKTIRCKDSGGEFYYSCGEICGFVFKRCGCVCSEKCHARHSDTDMCGKRVIVRCRCGKTEHEKLCGEGQEEKLRCDKKCGKLLPCGFHRCPRVCCSGGPECLANSAICPLSPGALSDSILCDCGRSKVAAIESSSSSSSTSPRSSCRDPLPGCGAVCGKKCSFGHECLQLCHSQPQPADPDCLAALLLLLGGGGGGKSCCPPCAAKVELACRCGRETVQSYCFVQNAVINGNDDDDDGDATSSWRAICARLNLDPALLPSSSPLLCERPCRKQLACGNPKHTCSSVCCVSAHQCAVVCQKLLNCKIHKCNRTCHGKRACPPCEVIISLDPIRCHCRNSVIDPPIRCSGPNPPVPACSHPCVRERPCGHKQQQSGGVPHACHSDAVPCPDCVAPCLPTCSVCGSKLAEFRMPCWKASRMPCSKCSKK